MVEISAATGIGLDALVDLDGRTIATYVDVLEKQAGRKGRRGG